MKTLIELLSAYCELLREETLRAIKHIKADVDNYLTT